MSCHLRNTGRGRPVNSQARTPAPPPGGLRSDKVPEGRMRQEYGTNRLAGWVDEWMDGFMNRAVIRVRRIWRQARCLSYEMGSFFVTVSYAMGVNRCGYRTIHDHKMGSFGNFCFLKGAVLRELASRARHKMDALVYTFADAKCGGTNERELGDASEVRRVEKEHRTLNIEH